MAITRSQQKRGFSTGGSRKVVAPKRKQRAPRKQAPQKMASPQKIPSPRRASPRASPNKNINEIRKRKKKWGIRRCSKIGYVRVSKRLKYILMPKKNFQDADLY